MFQTKIRHERFLPCLICYFVNLIITSSTASVYLPCAIRTLRRSSKHWTTRRRSVSVRERWYFCFLIRTPPLRWLFRLLAHGCYSSAVPTPSDRRLWAARWYLRWRHTLLLTEEKVDVPVLQYQWGGNEACRKWANCNTELCGVASNIEVGAVPIRRLGVLLRRVK